MGVLQQVRSDLDELADPERAVNSARFFKTGPGQYGEGDVFIGISVPQVRSVSKSYWQRLSLRDTEKLLQSKIHEERLAALIILVKKYKKGDSEVQQQIYDTYLASTHWINNWDLVDASAEHIVGAHLRSRSKKPLDKLARSANLWERRIAMIATFHYIKHREYDDALRVATLLLDDKHDLIHKAVGWMLREIGKRDIEVEDGFLREHCRTMPRTALRYAIERHEPTIRSAYMAGVV